MHLPVLLDETISHLVNDPEGTYVDCTFGGGGHTKRLLEVLHQDALIIALDKDGTVLAETKKTIDQPNIIFKQADFRDLALVLKELGIEKVNGIMLDLGVSSFQLDRAERGFSYHEDAFLDMRMDTSQDLTAEHIINNYAQAEITKIFFEYGEEKYARQIARAIVKQRADKPIETTLQLVEIIKTAVPAKYRRQKHPARKIFQALRIAVNQELESLIRVLPQAVEILEPGGKLCVITFHSLEDRIVKNFMREKARECICPPELPICTCDHQAQLKIMTRKPVRPSEEEYTRNPRARSAKLRTAAKLDVLR